MTQFSTCFYPFKNILAFFNLWPNDNFGQDFFLNIYFCSDFINFFPLSWSGTLLDENRHQYFLPNMKIHEGGKTRIEGGNEVVKLRDRTEKKERKLSILFQIPHGTFAKQLGAMCPLDWNMVKVSANNPHSYTRIKWTQVPTAPLKASEDNSPTVPIFSNGPVFPCGTSKR